MRAGLVRSPLVTIAVPVFNGDRFLRQCLDSLLGQTQRDFVLLVSDNASTDGTPEICREYAARDPRVQVHRHAVNVGMYGNVDFLLQSARAPYVKLANADDFWAPEMVADALAVMESDPAVELCYPMMTRIDEKGEETGRYEGRLHVMDDDPVLRFKRVLNEIGLVNQMMGLMRSDTARRLVRLTNHPASDTMFVAEMALYGKIHQTEKYQYFRRFHPDCASYDRSSESHQLARVYGQGAGRLKWLVWSYHMGLFTRVRRSPLTARDKSRLYVDLGRRMVWSRRELMADFLHALA